MKKEKKVIFLSYSSSDFLFAEMLSMKLEKAGHELWRDSDQIRAGDDWRGSIEEGIEACDGVVVAFSSNSANSAYVTFEWAYAVGMKKTLIPVKLEPCDLHPKLEPTQYLDFSYPKALPWEALIKRIEEIELPDEAPREKPEDTKLHQLSTDQEKRYINEILSYLRRNGYRMASFERLRKRIGREIKDEWFEEIISNNPHIFREAILKGRRPGLAKRVP